MKKFRLVFVFMGLWVAVVWGAELWENAVSRKAGETIVISWEYPSSPPLLQGFAIYRATGLTASPTKVATLGKDARQWSTTMPSGSTQQYRFLVRPIHVVGGNVGPAGKEVIVTRTK